MKRHSNRQPAYRAPAFALAIATCSIPCGSAAVAQATAQNGAATPPTSAQDSSVAGLGDIVVTARKRSETLQNVPASILAIGKGQIDNLNAKSLADLNGVTPNAHIGLNGTITIRGISSDARNIGFEAGAAVYIDGVYQGRPLGNNQDLVDVDRIEILRGPQGTLYGKNTTAGAISIVTARPGDAFSGKAEVQYGERDDIRASAYVAGPLIPDLLGFKISAYRRTADGYEKNVFNGQRYADIDALGGRAELRLTPGSWDISLRGDVVRDNSAPVFLKPVSGFAAPFAPGFDQVSSNIDQGLRSRGGGLSLTAEDDIGGGFTLTSVSAWRRLHSTLVQDDDFSPLDIAYHMFDDRSSQLSQEVRLASPSTGRLTYVVGAFYFHQKLDSDRPVTVSTGFPVQGTLNDIVETRTNAYALFVNADYHFTDKLTLNAGLRYTTEHKNLDFEQLGVPLLGYPFLTLKDSFTDTDLSPTASLSYTISPAVTAYVKYSKGFKSGGWNPDITSTLDIRFNPEKVTNYEAGIRTRFLQDKLAINLTGYYMDYDDLQVSQFLNTLAGYVITNAGKARIKGVEAEIQARPVRWLTLSGGGAFNDAKYREFNSGVGVNYAGQQFTNAPKFSAFLSGDIKAPLENAGDLELHADYRYQSNAYFDDARTVTPAGRFADGGYALLNARIGFLTKVGLELSVFGNNLADKRIRTNRLRDTLGLGLVLDQYGPPRQFGVRGSYKF